MKAVTSPIALTSIALLTAIGFGGNALRLPCMNFRSGYRELDIFLNDKVNGDNLRDNVKAIKDLIEGSTDEVLKHSEAFKMLALRFRDLYLISLGKDVAINVNALCSDTVLGSLQSLLQAAVNHNKNFMDAGKKKRRLDRMLIELVGYVREECYENLQEKWDALAKRDKIFAALLRTPAIEYFNSNVQFDNMFKRLIHRSKRTSKADDRKFGKIIRGSLLASQESSVKHSSSLKLEIGNRLIKPCQKLLRSSQGIGILGPAVHVLAIEMTVFPQRQKKVNQEQSKFEIDSLPAYVMCREALSKDRKLIGAPDEESEE